MIYLHQLHFIVPPNGRKLIDERQFRAAVATAAYCDGAQFEVCTGRFPAKPAYEPVTTFPVRIQDGMVQIKDDR